MTRKDYELIAKTISDLYGEIVDDKALEAIAGRFAEALAETNPRFNSNLFMYRAMDSLLNKRQKAWA